MSATAVLIPGNMCDARLWSGDGASLPAELTSRGHAIAHPDTTRDDTIRDMGARALASVTGPLLPIGFSMGGIVALEMARQAPARIVAMVLADTNAGADLPERAAARPAQQARVRSGALATIVADELKPAYLSAANRSNEPLRALLFDMAMALGDDVFVRQSEALRTRADNSGVLDDFRGSVLFICGAEDALCPPAWHEAMASRARRSTLRVIEGAGHMLPLERPRAFTEAIVKWLDTLGDV